MQSCEWVLKGQGPGAPHCGPELQEVPAWVLALSSLNISSSAHSKRKRAKPSVRDAFGMRVYQSRSLRFILKQVIRSHITRLIMVM